MQNQKASSHSLISFTLASILMYTVFVWLICILYGLLVLDTNVFYEPYPAASLGYVFGVMIGTFPAYALIAEIVLPPSSLLTIFAAAIKMYTINFPLGSALMVLYTVCTALFTVFVFHGMYKRASESRLWSDYVILFAVYGLFVFGIVYFFASVATCDVVCALSPNERQTSGFGEYFRWVGSFGQSVPPALDTRQAMGQIHDQLNNTDLKIGSACGDLNEALTRALRLGDYESAQQYGSKLQTCTFLQDLFKQNTSSIIKTMLNTNHATPQTVVGGVSTGLQNVTEALMTPVMSTALEGAAEAVVKMAKPE